MALAYAILVMLEERKFLPAYDLGHTKQVYHWQNGRANCKWK